jgi:hypothetical protein
LISTYFNYVDLRHYLYLVLSPSPFPSLSFHEIDRHGISICPAQKMPWLGYAVKGEINTADSRNVAHRLPNNNFHTENRDYLENSKR